jgi:hypothetical protein
MAFGEDTDRIFLTYFAPTGVDLMHSPTSYQLVVLAALMIITLFPGWAFSTTTVASWTAAHVQTTSADIPWD